jgi:hypothetical protein
VLRAFALIVIAGLLAVWVAPTWNVEERTLSLRVREASELRAALRSAARSLGQRMVSASREERRPPVAARPRPKGAPVERLTAEDRAGLDELVEDRVRDP